MTSTDEDLPATIDLSDLARECGRTVQTIRRWCKEKGVARDGFKVYTSDIAEHWPKLYASLKLKISKRRPVCPCCGEPTMVTCSTCDYESH